MRKEITRIVVLGISLILLLCLLIKPIYKINQEYIIQKFDSEINEIINEEPSAFFEHTFTNDSFNEINGRITLDDMSWILYSNKNDYLNTTEGLKVNGGFRLVQESFPDFVNIVVFASGNNSLVKVFIDDIKIGESELTENIKRYDFEYEASVDSKVEIQFIGDVTLQKIKINEYEPLTKDEATYEFFRTIIMQSGLITTNQKLINIDSYDLYEEYINEETNKLLEGVPFISLFKMIVEDFDHNISLITSTSNNNLKSYLENRRCPLISIIMFSASLSIIGSIGYIVVRFILDLIFKKSSNYLIPSLLMLFGFVLILNISTFTSINFFYGNHNIANKWRILFFEASNITLNLVLCAIFALTCVIVQFVNILFDYLNNQKDQKLKKKLIIYGSIITLFIVLILVGVIFH